MARFIRLIAIYTFSLLLLSTLIALNSKYDLLTDFRAKQFVTAFNESDQLIKQESTDERRCVVQQTLRNKGKHYNVIVLGSSRIMEIGKHLGFKNCLNLGVSGGGLKDLEIITGLVEENQLTADTFIVDYNPWYLMTETENSDTRYKHFLLDFRVKKTAEGILKFEYELADLFTSVKYIARKKSLYRKAAVTDTEANNFIKFTDGSIKHKVLAESVKKNRVEQFTKDFYQMKGFYSINEEAFSQFVHILEILSKRGQVQINMTPFHPDLFKLNKKDPRLTNIALSETRVLRMAEGKYKVVGSFNPDKLGMTDADFLDGWHITVSATRRMYGK